MLPLRMQGVGFRFLMGELPGIQTVIPVVSELPGSPFSVIVT